MEEGREGGWEGERVTILNKIYSMCSELRWTLFYEYS